MSPAAEASDQVLPNINPPEEICSKSDGAGLAMFSSAETSDQTPEAIMPAEEICLKSDGAHLAMSPASEASDQVIETNMPSEGGCSKSEDANDQLLENPSTEKLSIWNRPSDGIGTRLEGAGLVSFPSNEANNQLLESSPAEAHGSNLNPSFSDEAIDQLLENSSQATRRCCRPKGTKRKRRNQPMGRSYKR